MSYIKSFNENNEYNRAKSILDSGELLEYVTHNFTTFDKDRGYEFFDFFSDFGQSYYSYLMNDRQERVPHNLEQLGIFEGISGKYKYFLKNGSPETDENMIKFSRFIKSDKGGYIYDTQYVEFLYDLYEKLNPEIKQIGASDAAQKYTVLLGMTSCYNLDDIHDFIFIGGASDRTVEEKNRKKKIEGIIKKVYPSVYLGYVPSSKTIDKMEQQIEIFKKKHNI